LAPAKLDVEIGISLSRLRIARHSNILRFGSPTNAFAAIAGTITTHTHFTDNIVRVGLNYQFH